MPTPPSDEPLQKITINIYAKDYADLKRLEGHGWSTAIRNIIRNHLRDYRKYRSLIKEVEHGQ